MEQTKKYCILQNEKGLFLEAINNKKLNDVVNLLAMNVQFCDAPEYAARCAYEDKDSELLKKTAEFYDLDIRVLEVKMEVKTLDGEPAPEYDREKDRESEVRDFLKAPAKVGEEMESREEAEEVEKCD